MTMSFRYVPNLLFCSQKQLKSFLCCFIVLINCLGFDEDNTEEMLIFVIKLEKRNMGADHMAASLARLIAFT